MPHYPCMRAAGESSGDRRSFQGRRGPIGCESIPGGDDQRFPLEMQLLFTVSWIMRTQREAQRREVRARRARLYPSPRLLEGSWEVLFQASPRGDHGRSRATARAAFD